jgi:rubrerythrin
LTRDQFEQQPVATMMEGGLTTEEYLALYKPDLDSVRDVVSLAMGIEGQALDLYQRAANRASDNEISKSLMKIADEERAHLRQLGTLLD